MIIHLLDIQGWNPAIEAVETLRFTDGAGYLTHRTDDPPRVWYAPDIEQVLAFSRNVYATGTTGGRSTLGYGEIVMLNGSGEWDYLLEYGWSGRQLAMFRGDDADPKSAFELIFIGSLEQLEISLNNITVRLNDKMADLDIPIQETRYAGTNAGPEGIEGTEEDLADTVKVLLYGLCLNVRPAPVNTSKLIFQVHDGPMEAVLNVYDEGIPLGMDEITDGDMDVPASWTTGPGWTVADGAATHASGAAGDLSQALSLTVGGEFYVLTYELTASAGSVTPKLGASALSDPVGKSGRHFIRFTGAAGDLAFSASSDFEGSVDNVRLHFVEECTDLVALQSVSIGTGEYAVCLSLGLFRLGSTPAGEITADCRGDASGDGYVCTAADIAARILTTKGGLSSEDLIADSFSELAGTAPYELGVYIDSEISIPAVLDMVLDSIGGWYSITRLGRVLAGRFGLPSGDPVAEYDPSFWLADSFQKMPPHDEGGGLPVWRVTMEYGRNWTVQSGKPVGTTEFRRSRRAWLEAEYRKVSAEDETVKTAHLRAPELTFTSLLGLRADAEAEAERRLAIYFVRRDRFELTVPSAEAVHVSLGDTVRLTTDRLGLQAGKLFVVLGISENYTENETGLTVYG